MLTIFNDPAGVTGRRCVALDYGATLQENIERHLSGGADAELRINGVVTDPLTDPRLDALPARGDLVTITLRPRGLDPITWAYIAIGALAVYTVTALRNFPTADGAAGKDSPNNKLTAQTNLARAYQAVPDVYGYRRVWPDLIQPSTVEYIDHLKYVTEWLCVSRGKGTISSVQYAETPIGDIDGSSYEVFEPVPVDGYPERGTTTLNDVVETFASDEVNGQELPYSEAFADTGGFGTLTTVAAATSFTALLADGPSRADLKSLAPTGTAFVSFTYSGGSFGQTCTVLGYTVIGADVEFTFSSGPWGGSSTEGVNFTITPNGADTTVSGPYTLPVEATQIWWSTAFLRGLVGIVDVRAEWWQIDGTGAEIGGTRQTQTDSYADNTFDQRFYTKKVTPLAGLGRYRIQFTRLSPKNGDTGADVAKLEEVYAARRFETKQLPGVTVLRVTTKATLSATGFSDRKFNLRWQRHVRTLAADTLSASRNFARALAHIWTLAGNDIAGLDTDALAAINAEHGEDSELLRFDGSLDDADMSLGERLQFVANTARCTIWRDGTRWTATRDQARSAPEMQFDYRNLAAGGESVIGYAAHLPASNDGVEVEYVDQTTQAKKAYIRLNISTGGPVVGASVNPKKVKLPGCTTMTQAENRAQLEARRLIYQRVTVRDTALADASSLGLGALVRWIDPNDFGGDDLQAGEVRGISDLIIQTSEPLDWHGETTGRILFTGVDGKHLGPPNVCFQDPAGVRLLTLPAGLYVADADRQLGSRYAFAVGLSSDELEAAGLYVASEIRPAANGTVSIALAQYDARMYGGDSAEVADGGGAGDLSLDGSGWLVVADDELLVLT